MSMMTRFISSLLCFTALLLAWQPAAAQSWTAPSTVTTGQLMTAAFWNQQVRDNLSVLRTGSFAVASQAIGDLLCASSTTQFARIADVATGQVLISGGVGACPYYSTALVVGNIDTGQGVTEVYAMNQAVQTTSAVTFLTVDTGQGANELYAMDQAVRVADSPTFASVKISATAGTLQLDSNSSLTVQRDLIFNTGDASRTFTINGSPILDDWFDQSVKTTSAPTFLTVDTGQGANELYDMDQNVLTTSLPTFAGVSLTAASTIATTSAQAFAISGAGTGHSYGRIQNTSGDAMFGVESSTGGSIAAGSTAYATIVSSNAARGLEFATNAIVKMKIDTTTTPVIEAVSGDYGATGEGPRFSVGVNTNGGDAAGFINLEQISPGSGRAVWVDVNGLLRISIDAPQADGTPADTSGTVVGDQSSWYEEKDLIRPSDPVKALAAILSSPVYDFRYRQSSYLDPNDAPAVFTGLVGFDRHDWFLKNVGPQQNPALNEVNVAGYVVLSIQELARRVATLEAKAK